MICWKCLVKMTVGEDHLGHPTIPYCAECGATARQNIHMAARADRFMALVNSQVVGISSAATPDIKYVCAVTIDIMNEIARRVEAGELWGNDKP